MCGIKFSMDSVGSRDLGSVSMFSKTLRTTAMVNKMRYRSVHTIYLMAIDSFMALFHFIEILMHITMDCSRKDGKRGHVMCGNWLAIECEESLKNLPAACEEELLFFYRLPGSSKTLDGQS